MLKHVELGLGLTIAANSLPVRYEPSEGSMMIDSATMRSLELIQNLNDSRSKSCLYGLLNQTCTPMGARQLRSNILQPLTSSETLRDRYDALEELTTNEEMYFGVQNALKLLPDTGKLLTQIIMTPQQPTLKTTEQNINNVIALKEFVTKVGPIRVALSGAKSQVLQSIARACAHRGIDQIRALLDNSINEDTTYAKKPVDLRNQRVYAVKSGFNGLLDVARATYQESTADAMNHVSELGTEHNLSLEFCFDQSRQHYIRLPVSELEDRHLPEVFINVIRRKKNIECQTLSLIKHNTKIVDSHTEVMLMSDHVIQQVIQGACGYSSRLFKISESIAMLDILVAFAGVITTNDYVRPSIGDALALRAARHPIKETIHDTRFIPNDVYATQTRRFQIVTGCNMSGKSTYIRAVALINVMAQIGCFVPATQVCVPIVRQLLARVSTDDLVEANVSSFSAEMKEAAYILANVDKDSMVIIDELGRGTSSTDGLAISLAIAESLLGSRALVWFATHFRDLARILSERAGVTSMHLSVEATPESLKMSYRVSDGVEKTENYGLLLAKALPCPDEVIAKAEEVAKDLEEKARQRKAASAAVIHARRRNLVLFLKEQLKQAQQGKMEDAVLVDWLKLLQREFVARMCKIDQEARDAQQQENEGREEVDSEGRSRQSAGTAQQRTGRSQSMQSMLF